MRAIVVIVALVIAAFGVSVFLTSEVSPPEAPSDLFQPEIPAAATESGVAQGESPGERSPVLPTGAETAAEGEVVYHLRVVRGESKEPVAGAVVRWLPPSFDFAAIGEEERRLRQRDREAFVTRYGEVRTADSLGRVTLRGSARGISVHGRDGDWYGVTYPQARNPRTGDVLEPGPEYPLELRLDQTLVVRAVDADGEPVPGVTVRLSGTLIENGEKREQHYVGRSPPTDEQGLTRWPHVQTVVFPGQILDSARVAAVLFGGLGVPVPVDLFSVPDDPVEVVLPPFGSIEIAVLAPDGRPWRHPGTNQVGVMSIAELEASSGGYALPTVTLEEDGRAIAWPVRCGERFQLSLPGAGGLETTVEGPRLPGDRVRAELRMRVDLPVIAGRIVDREGRAVAGSFHLDFEDDRGPLESRIVDLDATGRFRAGLGAGMSGRTLSIKVGPPLSSLPSPGTTAILQMDRPLHPGVNDVGDLVLGEAPILVAGRMEWMDGAPVPYPQFELDYAREGSPPDSRDRWQPHDNLRPERPGDGRFIVRDRAKGQEYRLRLPEGIAPMAPVAFRPGEEDLRIRLEKGASVEVTVLGDSAELLKDLRFDLVSQLPPPPAEDSLLGARRKNFERGDAGVEGTRATCLWTGLASGSYRLTISCSGTPLVDLDLDVPSGRPAEDPRLRGIDLRGQIRTITVRVVDPGGDAVRASRNDAGVMIRGEADPETEWYGRGLDGGNGRVELHLPAPVDLIVFAPGFRSKEVSGVFADVTVRLEPAPQVRVRLASPLPELPGDATVNLSVTPSRSPGYRSPIARIVHRDGWMNLAVDDRLGRGDQRLTRDRDGAFVLDARGGGVVSLRLDLARRVDGRVRRASVSVRPLTLDLDTIPSDQAIELSLDPASLQEALEGIGK